MGSIFDKYEKRGAYHWRQISRNLFWHNAYVAARYRQVVEQIPKRAGRILDIGCGDGVLLSLIGRGRPAGRRGRLYGVDLDKASLAYAAAKIPAKLMLAPAEKLPFTNNFFDTVLATEIIEHLPSPEKFLAEARRVLKPAGRLIVTTPVKTEFGLTDLLHIQEFSPAELKKLVGQYFHQVRVITSHPLWLKRFYCYHFGRFGWYQLDLGRWLINLIVLITGWNLFLALPGRPAQQLLVGQK